MYSQRHLCGKGSAFLTTFCKTQKVRTFSDMEKISTMSKKTYPRVRSWNPRDRLTLSPGHPENTPGPGHLRKNIFSSDHTCRSASDHTCTGGSKIRPSRSVLIWLGPVITIPRTPESHPGARSTRKKYFTSDHTCTLVSDHTCTKLHVLSKSWFERNTTWIEEFDSSTISKLHVVWYARVSYFHVLWRAIIHVPRNVTMCWKYMYFAYIFTSTCTFSFKSVSACKTIHVTRLVHVVWSVHVVWLRGESCKVHVLWSKKAILQHGTLNNSR